MPPDTVFHRPLLCAFVLLATAIAGCSSGGGETPPLNQAPKISSSPPTVALMGTTWRYEVVASGQPAPVLSLQNAPGWVRVVGPRTLHGLTGPAHLGVHRFTLVATNGVQPTARQDITLLVGTVPQLLGTPPGSVFVGDPWVFAPSVQGSPEPTLSLSNAPAWIQLVGTGRAASLRGTPTKDNIGTHQFELTASNGVPPAATMTITIRVSAKTPRGDAFEPDDNPGQAKFLRTNQPQSRSIHVVGNVDWAKFTLQKRSAVIIETDGPTGDTVLTLHGPNDWQRVITSDRNGGNNRFSRIQRTGFEALGAGVYWLKVEEYQNNATIGAYTLSLEATEQAWYTVSATGAPTPRWAHTAVAFNSMILVWGGATGPRFAQSTDLRSGAIYDMDTNTWSSMTMANAPAARRGHSAAMLSNGEMCVWGGFRRQGSTGRHYYGDGGLYNQATNTWRPLPASANSPSPRAHHSVTCLPSFMIIHGGVGPNGTVGSGAVYRYTKRAWDPVATKSNGGNREGHSATTNGRLMFVFGGRRGGTRFSDMRQYLAANNIWSAVSSTNAPSARAYHSTVWAGVHGLLVWGGENAQFTSLNTGGIYNFGNTWTSMRTAGAPAARSYHTAVWSENQAVMVVWGGWDGGGYLSDGGQYDPARNTWAPVPKSPLGPRDNHIAICDPTGKRMFIWGGVRKGAAGWGDGAVYWVRR